MEIGLSEPVRIEGNRLVITRGEQKPTREAFFNIMESRVQILDNDSYVRVDGNNSALGHFNGVIYQVPEGKAVEDANIYINRDDFIINDNDFTDLIPVTVRHEIFEMWTYAKNGWSLSPAPDRIGKENRVAVAHGLATMAEYSYAFEIGKAERYLDFIRQWSIRLPPDYKLKIIQENEKAYSDAKSKFERQRKLQ